MRVSTRLLSLLAPLLLTGCVGPPGALCRGSLKSMVSAELLFGAGRVSDAAWKGFLDTEVSPRFPDGLTVFDAAGQWRDPARGVVTRERSKVLLIVFRDDPQSHERLNAIADAYKRRFNQRSVGVVVKPACASF
jgi:hypothetical protein